MATLPERRPTKYQHVFEDLRREILSGRYPPGQKLPSEAELTGRFATSRITVGRAVRELQLRGLVERRAGSGTYVRADRTAGFSFGLLIPDLGRTEIFEPICQGMADAPRAADHVLLWGSGGSGESTPAARQEQAWRTCQQYVARRVAGVFFAPLEQTEPADHTNERIIAALEKARIPVVLLDRDYLPYPARSRHDLVGIDNRRTGFVVTEHLINLGCRRIALVASPHAASTVGERLAGYREALFVHGIEVRAPLVWRLDPEDVDEVRRRLAATGPDAFVGTTDRSAGQLMRTLLGLGYRVPADFRVVGIDDVGYARLLPVPLTTMHQPCREIGLAAMAAMLERLARPDMPVRDVRLECPLVLRESCGAAGECGPAHSGRGGEAR